MQIYTNIKYKCLTFEQTEELKGYMDNLFKNKNTINNLLKFINTNIAFSEEKMCTTWAYAQLDKTYYPKREVGEFIPQKPLFEGLKKSCITLSKDTSSNYITVVRIQTVPLPL